MAAKALWFRTNENELAEIKKVASVLHMTLGGVIRDAVREYIEPMKQKPLYGLMANIEEADPEESAEVLAMIENMTDDDREIVRVDHIIC